MKKYIGKALVWLLSHPEVIAQIAEAVGKHFEKKGEQATAPKR